MADLHHDYDQGYPSLKKECDRWVGARHCLALKIIYTSPTCICCISRLRILTISKSVEINQTMLRNVNSLETFTNDQ